MKRILSLALGILMLFSVSAIGEEIDTSSMSLDELVSLRTQIQNEITNRLFASSSVINSGVYLVGKDIKAGQYEIDYEKAQVCLKVALFKNETRYESYRRFSNASNEIERDMLTKYSLSVQYVYEGGSCYVGLEDGMVMTVSGGSGILNEIKPVWAP